MAHENIIKIITNLIDSDNLPHLLLYGPPGTGKTRFVCNIHVTLRFETEANESIINPPFGIRCLLFLTIFSVWCIILLYYIEYLVCV